MIQFVKRFTDTEKWKDPWFRKLTPRLKTFWSLLCDLCDSAGVLQVDWDRFTFEVGESITEADLAFFGPERIQILPNGRILIKKFIPFQYGTLSTACPAHKRILENIEIHGLVRVGMAYEHPIPKAQNGVATPYPSHRVEERKGRGIGKEGGTGGNQIQPPLIPPDPPPSNKTITPDNVIDIPEDLNTPTFVNTWQEWMEYRRAGKHRGKKSIEFSFRAQLKHLSRFGPDAASAMLRQSILNGWQGIFELDNQQPKGTDTNGQSGKRNWGGIDRNAGTYNEGLAELYAHAASNDPLNPKNLPGLSASGG